MSGLCLFCRIADNQISAHEVFRNARVVAFMDTGPIRPGHLQIIPVEHYETFDELPGDIACEIIRLGQKLAKVMKEALKVEKVAFLFTGGDIAHAHAHLVPLVEKEDITSRLYIEEEELTFRELPSPGDDVLREIASLIAIKLGV